MDCSRCGGFMVCDMVYTEEGSFLCSRCLVCGNVTEKEIMLNRLAQESLSSGKPHERRGRTVHKYVSG